MLRIRRGGQKGSISLEYILYIGAVAAISGAIFTFYQDIAGYLSGVGRFVHDLPAPSTTTPGGTTPTVT